MRRVSIVVFAIASMSLQSLLADDLWKEPQDTVAALTKADHYAWRLFVALNWPADVANRTADSKKAFGENAITVWESWKLSSGPNDEVFLKGGVNPGPWLPGRKTDEKSREDFEALPLQQRIRLEGKKKKVDLLFDPEVSISGNENHMNEPAYRFIRENELFNVEGQEAFFQRAQAVFAKARTEQREVTFPEYRIDFPSGAKEIKAQWRPIGEQEKNRYRWVEVTDSQGVKRLFGLTALHITTKDIPNWLWATFEHVDNPKRDGAEPWIVPTRDHAAGPDGYPEDLGIQGTRWQYYRLRGTQTEFVNSVGQPTILANSQTEQGFQTTSSCITCHARAAIGARQGIPANRLSIFDHEYGEFSVGSVGKVEESLFTRKSFTDPFTGQLDYLQLDFVWSFMRAKRKANVDKVENPTFEKDVVILFREKDIRSMKRFFDLTKYDDVKKHSDAIYSRLEEGTMPCDAPWTKENVDVFRRWIDTGMPK